MIKKRHVGFHAPLSLPSDAVQYVDAMGNLQGHSNASKPAGHGKAHADENAATSRVHAPITGNDSQTLAKVRAEAEALLPVAQQILQTEATLSALYAQYDAAAVVLWNELTEARDHAELYAEKHDDAGVHAITAEVVYHGGRLHRHGAAPPVAK